MNKVFKVIWSEARNAYVVVSEMAKSHGTKSCSTKKLLAMLIATGVMTCASFDVLAEEPSAAQTLQSQYVAFAPTTSSFPDEYEQTIDGHKYIYDVANQYWVREGYILVLEKNAKLHTPLSANGRAADVAYTGGGDTSSILQSVTSLVSASGTVTNMGESLNSINASAYAGVSHSGGTQVAGTWNYIIEDSSWKDSVAPGNYKYGYVDLVDSKLPKGFKTAEDPNTELTWDDIKQCYTYKGNPVDYSNVYVIDGKIGVFTNKDGSKVYTGNVFGKNNEVLMTVKDANNKFYSYWASEVTDPSATMQSYRMADYEKDLSVLLENEKKLYRNDIKEVTLTKDENSATISLLRNGDTDAGAPVKGAISVSSGGGTGGSDTFVKISNGTAEKTFATGSKVEAIVDNGATTGIKINGQDYTIKSGSKVSVTQNAAGKTTTITVDDQTTTIKDTDTTYTAGNGIEIDETNGNAIYVKLADSNLAVDSNGLALKKDLTGMQSIKGAGEGKISFDGANVKVNDVTIDNTGKISGVADGALTADSTDAVNGSQLKKVSDSSVNVDLTNISNSGKTEIVNIAKAADVHVKDGAYSVKADGTVTMKYVDGNGNEVTGKELKITDVASAAKLDGLNTTVTNIDGRVTTNSTNITTLQGEVITSGSIGANGKVELTKSNGSKVEVGTVKDYSVTSGKYDQTTQKLTLTKTDTYGNATSGTVDIDLSGIQSGDKNWTAQANGTDVKPNTDNKVNFINGDNTNVTTSGDGVIAVNLNNALTGIQSITGVGTGAGSISFADGAIKLNNKVTIDNTGKITGVAEGTIAAGSTDAVNGSQLYDVKNSINTDISNKTFGLEDDKGNKATSTLGNTVQVKGADGITSTVKDGALEIGLKLQDNSNLVVNSNGLALNTALTGIQSINGAGGTINLAGSAITINETTFNKDGRIQNVAAGTETKDAVNFGQLDATNKKVDNLTTEVGKGWTVATDNGTATKVGAGDTVKFSGADDNIKVSNDGKDVKVELNKDLTVDSVKAGDFFMDKNEGVGYKGKAYITSSGLNANGQTITNVKAGEAETDAVNVGQLNAVKAEASKKTTLSNGKNTTVTSVTTDGQTDYKVNVAGDLKDITSIANGASEIKLNADSIIIANTNKTFAITNSGIGMSYVASDYSTKAIMLGENGTTISGGLNVAGSKITGVVAGTVDTDAVNVGQLNAVKETANKGWKLKTNNGNVSDVKPGDEVEFDGDDNIKVSNAGNKVSFKLNNKLTGIESIAGVGGGSISFSGGNVTINNNVTFGSNGQIHNVTAGTASTDAVNVGQLNAAVQAGNTDTHIKPGEYGVGADNKVNMDVVDKTGTKINTVTITDVAKASDLGNVNNINNDLKNSNGTTTVVDAVNNLNQKLDNKVGDLQYSKVDKGDIADGDSTTTAIGKLDQKLNDVAATAAKQHTTVSGSGNIVVEDPTINADGGKNYNVKLADDINVNSVTANTFKADQTVMNKDGLKVGEKVSVTENAVTAGKTSISDDGVKVGDKTYISADGLNANDQKVTNVSDGKVEKDSKDAINGGQLHQAKADINNRIDGVENQVISNTNRINKLGSRVNKVGAGAAALAALHPMDFDPDDKLTFSAGYGNYAGENAAAIGAYYRPDEKVMFSVAGTVGNGENMVNAGVSFALDRTNHVSNSRTALAREVIDLRGQLAEMGAKMARMEKTFGMLDETKTKLFPDVPANHWAYEYIAKLAGNGYIEGYPDGNFGGDRLMTRYEFAAMLYRAIENGAALEEKIIKEFEPELGRIRVDRISGEDGDRDKIERVRVNDTKGERDHYGNKLAK